MLAPARIEVWSDLRSPNHIFNSIPEYADHADDHDYASLLLAKLQVNDEVTETHEKHCFSRTSGKMF
jgi:hypothetical protein